ncbi:MAG: MotA/TolQ/ExbB proton channel family protein [Halobacteriovoraceae bacterium]|nr:MotA/TolQ/ExbB proton channel family protein [Halobacteriovoraceae bacterium]
MKGLRLILEYLGEGGWICYPLLVLFFIMTYTVGFRFYLLARGRNLSMKKLFKDMESGKGSIQHEYIKELQKLEEDKQIEKINWLNLVFCQEINRYAGILNTVVLLVPLLGLLGIVVGIMETFSLYGDLVKHSWTTTGEVSKILVIIQLSLVMAIPGLFFSRYLKKIEDKTRSDFNLLGELFLQKKKRIIAGNAFQFKRNGYE